MATDAAEDANASPNLQTYLDLANYVYNSGQVSGIQTTGTQFVPLDYPGGKPVEDLDTGDGFYGQAFIENSTSQPPQLVIAFEGTNIVHSPPSGLRDAQIQDDRDIFNGVNPNSNPPGTSPSTLSLAFADAVAFTNNAIGIAETNDNVTAGNIYLDGHSLGGAEAEYVSSKLNLPGTTFGAPGIYSSANPVTGNTGANSGLIDYVANGDPVGNYAYGSVLAAISQAGDSIQHWGTVKTTGTASNSSLMKAVSDYYGGDKPIFVARFLYGFVKYHVLSSYASDLGYQLSSADNSTGADIGFFDTLPPLVGATGPGECFLAGTRLMTLRGARAIEDVARGDTVVTASGIAKVIWVGRRRLDVAAHPRPTEILPIRIAAHAFADSMPARDLYVSPGHGVVIDGALIPARLIVNGTTIAQVERARVEYWHVELERHDLVLAEGLAVESYLDCGHRAAFEGQGGVMRLHPNFSAYAAQEGSCLPWIVAGPMLEAARARLTARADETRPARDGQPAGLRRGA